jgi:multiple sugar transport system ATP-binding protein
VASLTLSHVGKFFGAFCALADVSIEIADGEFLVLVGPSGCGKTTLLRMIAGLESLTKGAIQLGARDVSAVDPKDRDVAMVFQNYALYPHMTVFENMAFGLEQRRTPKAEITTAVTRVARTLDLEPLLARKPGALSGGQRQRVAMGRAIVRQPSIFLMDEPLSNLDAKLRVQMRTELKLLRQRLGVTTVYVTHDQVEAMTLGDRVAVLAPYAPEFGVSLQQCDSPQRLYLEPRNMFVAGFIGSPAMNFLYVNLVRTFAGLDACIADTDIVLRLTPHNCPRFIALGPYADSRIVLGVRPEYFSLVPSAGWGSQPIDVDVLVSEQVGPDAFLHFDLPTPEVGRSLMRVLNDGESSAADARFVARVGSERLERPNGPMQLHVDLSRLHFFDAETTERIF